MAAGFQQQRKISAAAARDIGPATFPASCAAPICTASVSAMPLAAPPAFPFPSGAFMTAKALLIPVTPFQQNCRLLWCESTRRAVVIDPGGDVPEIGRAIAQAGVTVEKIWLTHGHIDHAGGAADLKAQLNVPIEGPHRDDLFLLENVVESARMFGIPNARNVTPDRWLKEGDTLEIGEIGFDVLHCPGHSPGSVAFINAAQKIAIVGDVLFSGSIGRTDLPGGNQEQLLKSIRDKLLPLDDDYAVLCGHGPSTTIGRERATNPFLQQSAAEPR
jgi:hydroxyacylglutathione hydrolase